MCWLVIYFVARCGYMEEPARKNPTKNKMLRARCTEDLQKLAIQAAGLLQLDAADVIRIGTQQYAASVVYRAITPPPVVQHA